MHPAAVLRSVHVDPDAESIKTVRDFVEDCCRDWEVDAASDVAVLLASELATNAVKHARTPLTVWLGHRPDRLVLSVEDASHAHPAVRHPDAQSEDGRGMLLVDVLSERWGELDIPTGKRVWAEIAIATAP